MSAGIILDRGFDYSSSLTITDENNNPVDLSPYTIYLDIYDSTGQIQVNYSSQSSNISVTNNIINIYISGADTQNLNSGYYILYATSTTERKVIYRGQVEVFPEVQSNVEYLIPYLRVKLGDAVEKRYEDKWLNTALILAVKESQRYLGDKYLIDENGIVYRNPNFSGFTQEYGVIETRDEPIIVILAAIIVMEGSLENSAWDAVSWKDNEISFSNLEQFRTRGSVLDKLIDELNNLILPPVKRLATARVQRMPGYGYPEKKSKY